MKTTEELKNLLYKNETVADAAPDAIAAAQDFCEGYKTFLDNAKTEREATAYSEKLLTAAGYQKFVPGTSYAPGTKVYTINREKCVLAATIGTKGLEEGFHLNIAHIDSPRLDLRPVPVFEKNGIGYLRTHYYGGGQQLLAVCGGLALGLGVIQEGLVTLAEILRGSNRVGRSVRHGLIFVEQVLEFLSGFHLENPSFLVIYL